MSFNSQRASPFRRPESPLGRSPSTVRAPTPQGSPLKKSTPSQSPTKFASTTPSSANDGSWIRQQDSPALAPSKSPIPFRLPQTAPRDSPPTATTATRALPARPPSAAGGGAAPSDPLSSIPPAQLHTMRESFSALDRANSGAVSAADVATALAELGLDASPRSVAAYFPAGAPARLNLGAYLALLSRDLARLSRREELMAAFAAFDDDDSGQIDVAELREALLTTAPEAGQMLTEDEVDAAMEGFVGRRVLKKGQVHPGLGGKKDVFRYGDFTASVWGGGAQPEASN